LPPVSLFSLYFFVGFVCSFSDKSKEVDAALFKINKTAVCH
jgi:hypothetical protein